MRPFKANPQAHGALAAVQACDYLRAVSALERLSGKGATSVCRAWTRVAAYRISPRRSSRARAMRADRPSVLVGYFSVFR
jgi:hypothetical protein